MSSYTYQPDGRSTPPGHDLPPPPPGFEYSPLGGKYPVRSDGRHEWDVRNDSQRAQSFLTKPIYGVQTWMWGAGAAFLLWMRGRK